MSSMGGDLSSSHVKANRLREEAIDSLVNGDIDFFDLVAASKTNSNKALAKIRLLDILLKYGWNRRVANAALIKNGFGEKDNISSIRRNSSKVSQFATLHRMETARWDMKPVLGTKFPKEGSLSVIVAELVNQGFELPVVEVFRSDILPEGMDDDDIIRNPNEPLTLDRRFTASEMSLDEDELFGDDDDVGLDEDELFGGDD